MTRYLLNNYDMLLDFQTFPLSQEPNCFVHRHGRGVCDVFFLGGGGGLQGGNPTHPPLLFPRKWKLFGNC